MITEAREPFDRKIALSVIVTLLIAAIGSSYQFYYLEERTEYEQAIQAYAVKHQGAALDPFKLRHLATLALDHYGPTELHRLEEDYRILFEETRS